MVVRSGQSNLQVYVAGCWNSAKRSRGVARDEALHEPARACCPLAHHRVRVTQGRRHPAYRQADLDRVRRSPGSTGTPSVRRRRGTSLRSPSSPRPPHGQGRPPNSGPLSCNSRSSSLSPNLAQARLVLTTVYSIGDEVAG
jgi:hypothetical protein